MQYAYKGIDKKDEQRCSGKIEAVSRPEALRLLSDMNIEVFALDSKVPDASKGKAVTKEDLVLPLQELSTLVSSGVSLVDALAALSQNEEHLKLGLGFKNMTSWIESGDTFSDAIAKSELPFPSFISPLIQAGELSGELKVALQNAAAQIEYEQGIKNDIKSAITYPVVLIFSGLAAMLIIFFAVVPKFSHMLEGDKELPFLAFLVLSAGKTVNDSPLIVVSIIVAIALLLLSIFKNSVVKRKVIDFSINVPVLGAWLSEQDTAKWASLTAAMLQAKVELVTALRLAASASAFTVRRRRANAIVEEIEAGTAFNEAVRKSNLIPTTSMNLISVGDKTGQLADMLSAVAKLHDASCKRRMKQVLTLMEPIAILIVGILIGIMILGIVLAITASTDIAI